MPKNLAQVYAANPVSNLGVTDVMYVAVADASDGGINAQNMGLAGYTEGSVIFANASGNLTQDATGFTYNPTTNLLSVDAVKLNGITASRLLSTNGSKETASVTDLSSWVLGTSNRIDSNNNGLGGTTINIASTYVGQTSITTVGTITTGTWNAGYLWPITAVASSPYVVLAADYYLSVDTTSARTIQLPNAPTTGRPIIVKDRSGSAATNNITITTVGGAVNIDGLTSITINTNYASLAFVFNGTSYEIC